MIDDLYKQIKLNTVPQHIAIIMDGNGRWAKEKGLPRIKGHEEGANSIKEIMKACKELDIKVLTLYAFSMENWQRPKNEIQKLMKLLVKYLQNNLKTLLEEEIKLMAIGELSFLPNFVFKKLNETIELTKNNKKRILNLALSYSSRLEIVSATKKLCEDVKKGLIEIEEINEKTFSDCLYTKDLPEPDLLIRTSGEFRISNFLLWQLSYTEIYITNTYWPDFRKKEFYKAIIEYQHRKRRFGKIIQ